jgi:uncharacterized glyoxalase superfamily protein PhnB
MTASWLPDGFHTLTPNIVAEDGRLTHCALRIGDSTLNVGTAMEGWPAHGLVAQIFVEAPDALYEGRVSDPFGNIWIIATLKERLSPEEMQRRLQTEGF